ncbi:protein PHLOEM PROTEIN 2-LIKE A9-like isoform X2 [Alnus glutinosa]|uniref:protein PHLOEM PROTEIN 2-LIKE A9-like isoform X2 n=1 Tax=Alnus glutinosa TaxID=3517 RepID=UPI002D77CFBF|nr:protein PHLOEM PROTEIN 2-LIKE A9-like isoform X2 [Alnus glutinosa]
MGQRLPLLAHTKTPSATALRHRSKISSAFQEASNVVLHALTKVMKVALYEQNEKPSSALEEDLAELIQVSWLEITGSYELELKKTYEVGFKVSYTPEAFGWNGCPVYVMAKFGKKGKYIWKRAKLTDKAEKMPFEISEQALRITSDTENTLYFGLYEVWSGKWKGGLKIHEAFIKKVDT